MAPEEKTTGVPGPRDNVAGPPTVVLPSDRPRPPADRPRPPRGPDRRRAPLPVAASLNALWAALVSFLPMLGTVAAVTLVAPHPPALAETIRFGVGGWLLAHGVPLRVAGAPIGLVPLAITALAAWRCGRAGRNTMRAVGARGAAGAGPAVAVASAIGLAYGGIGGVLALLAANDDLEIGAIRATVSLGLFATGCAFVGATRGTKFAARVRTGMPRVVRDALRTGVIGALLLVAAGAAAVGGSLAVHGGRAASMLTGLHLDATQQAGVVLACLAFAPNVSVWASAYLAGPGFSLVAVPQLPVFAAAPQHPVTGAAQLLLATPLVAGAAAGYLLSRRRRRLAAEAAAIRSLNRPDTEVTRAGDAPAGAVSRWPGVAAAGLSGIVAWSLLAAAGWAAAGALGAGAMASTGQVGPSFAAIAGLGISLGAMIGALGRTT